jgi:hypothetical protein
VATGAKRPLRTALWYSAIVTVAKGSAPVNIS